MRPQKQSIVVKGFQTDRTRAIPFQVLSHKESEAHEVDYGHDVGTISMTVYREKHAGGAKHVGLTAEGDLVEDAQFLDNYPTEPASGPDAAKARLHSPKVRGLIVGDSREKVGSKMRRVHFNPDPTPIMDVTITYYRKRPR
jgi:hypothetical protein